MVVDANAENLLRLLLTDYKLLQLLINLDRLGRVDVCGFGLRWRFRFRSLSSLANNPPTAFYTFVADEDTVGTGNQHTDLLLLLFTERASFLHPSPLDRVPIAAAVHLVDPFSR